MSSSKMYFHRAALVAAMTLLASCMNNSSPSGVQSDDTAPLLPVFTLKPATVTIYKEFPVSLEGKNNIEIRPQVDGYLDKIYVEEGAFVKAGQPLFKIDSRVYQEQMNMAESNLRFANANVEKAKIEVDRLEALVQSKVISDVQLKTARTEHAAALAAAGQAKSSIAAAKINIGFTTITAPVSGYIGRIPYKKGSLLSKTEPGPLTLLSDVSEIYAYFSLSEPDFIAFQKRYKGTTINEKIKNIPALELVIADNTIYPEKGQMSLVVGQFDKTTGAISVRALFSNADGMLRTGNTGRIRVPEILTDALTIPQVSTFEIQDKIYVYVVGKDNKVSSKPVTIGGKTETSYFITGGLIAGEKIALTGIGNLKNGDLIRPEQIAPDSLLTVISNRKDL